MKQDGRTGPSSMDRWSFVKVNMPMPMVVERSDAGGFVKK
jgi:hypothetical protein